MPSQHKTTPLSIRLPDPDRQRLRDYARSNSIPVRQVIITAIREKLDREQAAVHFHFAARHRSGEISVTPACAPDEIRDSLRGAGISLPELVAVTRGEAPSAVMVMDDGTWVAVSGCVGPCEPLAAALAERGEHERRKTIAGNGETGEAS